jgi:hypothetical protein
MFTTVSPPRFQLQTFWVRQLDPRLAHDQWLKLTEKESTHLLLLDLLEGVSISPHILEMFSLSHGFEIANAQTLGHALLLRLLALERRLLDEQALDRLL